MICLYAVVNSLKTISKKFDIFKKLQETLRKPVGKIFFYHIAYLQEVARTVTEE